MSADMWRHVELRKRRVRVAVRAHELLRRIRRPKSFRRLVREVRRAG